MTSKTVARLTRLEKLKRPSEDKQLEQECIQNYKAQNLCIANRLEEIDNERELKLYQSVLSTREQMLKNALNDPKAMCRMVNAYRYSKTSEAQRMSQELKNRIERRMDGSGQTK